MQVVTKIIVDKRERASGIPILLKGLGMRVEYHMLPMGDYILTQGYAIERKEVHDFMNSLFSGRLFDQASRIMEVYEKIIFIVEGNLQNVIKNLSNPRSLWGALASLAIGYNLHIFFTYNHRQTADLLYTLSRQDERTKHEKYYIYKKHKTRTQEEMKITILSSLPGIGPKLAKNILDHFNNLREVFSSSVAELSLVNGIGRVKAGKIVKILDSKKETIKNKIEQTKLGEDNIIL